MRRSRFPGALPALAAVRDRLAAGVACQVGAALAGAVPMIAVVELARRALAPPGAGGLDGPTAGWLVATAGAALLIRVGLTAAATYLTHLADTALQLRLRRDLAARLGLLPLAWFGRRNSGSVKRAVVDDVGALHHLVAHALPNLVTALVTPVVLVVYLLATTGAVTMLALVPLGAGYLLHRRAMRDVAARMGEYGEASRRLDAAAVEFVQGISVVKVFGGGGRAHHRFRDATGAYATFLARWTSGVTPWMVGSQLLYSAPVVLLALLSGGTVLLGLGMAGLAELVALVIVAPGLAAPALTIGYGMQDLASGRAAAGRIAELLATPGLPQPTAPAPDPDRDAVAVEFDGVTFSHDGTRDVLRDVSLRLEPRTVTALVGPSGSGKSTLASLLARFADVDRGAVRVAGTDIRELTTTQLYSLVGFVFQDVGLLRDTVEENIRLGRPGATRAQVRAAATAAAVDERIARLPQGYGSVVGATAMLSTGEAQRVTIARALLADTPVVVLDEATTAVDPEAEAEIQDALAELVAGRTVLVVAHRLASVVDVDQIVVLDGGAVVERGRHDELLAADGRYAALWRAQQVPATAAVTGEPAGTRAGEGG